MSRFSHQRERGSFQRLADALDLLKSNRTRLPYVVEFCGMPKAGKTTILSRTARALDRLGLRTVVVPEAATTKIDLSARSDLFAFNVLTCLENIAQVVTQSQRRRDVDAVLLDRGPYDSLVWFEFLRSLGLLSGAYARTLREFVTMPPWFDQVHLVAFVDNDWPTYVQRYGLDSPVVDDPRMNERHFETLRSAYQRVLPGEGASTPVAPRILTIAGQSRIQGLAGEPLARESVFEVWQQAQSGASQVADAVLSGIGDHRQERIATIPASILPDEVVEDLEGDKMRRFIYHAFGRDSRDGSLRRRAATAPPAPVEYVERAVAERDPSRVQLVAAAYIRRNGAILVLRRARSEDRDELRGRLAVLVTGHVDQVDATLRHGGTNEVENCLLRELREEVAHLDLPSVEPRMAIRLAESPVSRQHLALVYEVSTYSSRVTTVDLPGAGDFERNPEFWPLSEAKRRIAEFDAWSRRIISRLA
ncbi:MAG: AAA family ATPase [Phycisphaerales bacterium]